MAAEKVNISPSSFGLVPGPTYTPTDAKGVNQLAEEIRPHQQADSERPLAVTRNPILDFTDTILVRGREKPFNGRGLPEFLRGGGDYERTLKLVEPIPHASQAVSSNRILDKVEGGH